MGLKLFKSVEEEPVNQGVHHFQGLGVPRPASLDLLLYLPRAPMEVQICHGWSSWDHSPNVRPVVESGGGLTARRWPAADSTDCVRGKVGYRRGLHVWRLGWPPGQRGSHAAVGVGTASAHLHCPGYQVMLGGQDGESWGWELGSNRLHHAGSLGRCYPAVASLPVPENILVALDCDKGTLSFLVDGEYLGVAFDGLKGKTLYPMVSCVWGNASITLTYINGLDGQPLALAELCRGRIRRTLGHDRISAVESLPLPATIKTYLQHS